MELQYTHPLAFILYTLTLVYWSRTKIYLTSKASYIHIVGLIIEQSQVMVINISSLWVYKKKYTPPNARDMCHQFFVQLLQQMWLIYKEQSVERKSTTRATPESARLIIFICTTISSVLSLIKLLVDIFTIGDMYTYFSVIDIQIFES